MALADRSFLKLWSYPNVFRDQGAGPGKEICDLLVVFGESVLIFSDKACEFPTSGDLTTDWRRWYRRAVERSAKQVWGGERWIRQHPDRIFLDPRCKVRFPFDIPPGARFHRLVVARGVSRRLFAELGSKGSLMISPYCKGRDHYLRNGLPGQPFAVGQVTPDEGYVHVLDETALEILLATLDTIRDFCWYLARKEDLIASGKLLFAAGEEDLLASYLKHTDRRGRHNFPIRSTGRPGEVLMVPEGEWESYQGNVQRKAQIAADKVSYRWDSLLERSVTHALQGTTLAPANAEIEQHESVLRLLAAEPRTRRRFLAQSLTDLVAKASAPDVIARGHNRLARLIKSQGAEWPCYVFLVLGRKGLSDDKYRRLRMEALRNYCMVAKLEDPDALNVVGIATEPPGSMASEDVAWLDARSWGTEQGREAERLQQRFGIFKVKRQFAQVMHEYPVEADGSPRRSSARNNGKVGRNEECPCGSGKKFKRCCGG